MNLERFSSVFQENFSERDELGASVSVWQRGREVANLAGGFCDRVKIKPWTASTLVLFWSATKGLAASCVLHSLHRQGLSLETKVCEFWPEFAQGGKEAITAWATHDIIGERLTLKVIKVVQHYGHSIVTAHADGLFDKRGLPDPLELVFYFSSCDNKIVQLIILRNQSGI